MPTFTPTKTALLLMDYQTAIIGMVGEQGAALLERAQKAREAARAAGIAVMYVRVAFTDADTANISPNNKSFSALKNSGMLSDSNPMTAIHPDLAPAADEEVFRKTRVGAFSTTHLAQRLKARGIDTLILAGISTSGVVLSTMRDAVDHDYKMYVISDLCADGDAEVHRVLMEKVFPRQADVITLADFETAVR